MKYILDTDTISYYLNSPEEHIRLFLNIENTDNEDLATTIINYSEIMYGAYLKGYDKTKRLQNMKNFLQLMQHYQLDTSAIDKFVELKVNLRQQGSLIPDMDLMIAAITMANDGTLVTHNTKHFSRIKGLKLEDWCI